MATVFVCGADMEPGLIRARDGFGAARFTGVGSIAAADFPAFSVAGDRIWGLVIEGAGVLENEVVEIARRDGTVITGVLGTLAEDVTNREAVVAQARYWELPPSYWRELVEGS